MYWFRDANIYFRRILFWVDFLPINKINEYVYNVNMNILI